MCRSPEKNSGGSMGVMGYNCNMFNKTNCKFGNNEIYFFLDIYVFGHPCLCLRKPSTLYCLMSKIRITKNYKTVLKYSQNEFVVYIDFTFLTLSSSL